MATKTKRLEEARLRLAAEQRADFLACRDSKSGPVTFAKRHATIETVSGRPFRPKWWPKQIEVIETLHRDRRIVVLKARRMGLSWIVLIYALWLAIFQQGARILILCKNEGVAATQLDRVRRMLDRMKADPTSRHLLTDLKEPASGKTARDAVTTLQIGTSVIRALPAKARAARLETAAFVILDEFAFATEAPEIWRAILPTTEAEDDADLEFVDDTQPVLEGDGALAVISTGNGETGAGAEFFRQWTRAESGESGFAPLFLGWRDRPDRDDAWAESMRRKMGDAERFKTEYPEVPSEAFLAPDAELVFDRSQISAAVVEGAKVDRLIGAKELFPVGGQLVIGVDFGTHSHIVLGWPLEGGGMHLMDEVAYDGADVTQMAAPLAAKIKASGYRLHQMRFDASMPGLAALFKREMVKQLGYDFKVMKVPFGKFKRMTIAHQNWLFGRTLEGSLPRLTISPRCERYLDQARRLEWDNDQVDKIKKEDDHGPDAGIALLAPDAARRRKTVKEAIQHA